MISSINSSLLLLLLILILLLSSSNIGLCQFDDDDLIVDYAPIVDLENFGKIRGLIQKVPIVDGSNSETEIYFYQGIRYGKAKRFERSEFADKWPDDVYDAIEYRDACPQLGLDKLFSETKTISEDCLYLNIWTPKSAISYDKSSDNHHHPVMVWIHGGGYKTGTIFSSSYDAGVFSGNRDVVMVSIAYRLGPFGFLYSGDDDDQLDAKGNQGLHDQLLALRWIQENIHNFGGDPKQVTIFGESAGSKSVGLLILSPLAKNLFKRAIMQSGAPNSYFGVGSKQREYSKMISFVNELNCTGNDNIKQIMKCLKNKTIEEILDADEKISSSGIVSMTPIYGDDLLPLNPVEALKTGQDVNKVDLLFGANRDEGTIFLISDLSNPNLTLDDVRVMIRDYINVTEFNEDAVEFYTRNLNLNSSIDELRQVAATAFADYFLVCPAIIFAEALFKLFPKNQFYSYRLMLPIKSLLPLPDWLGVIHGEDVWYLFGIPNNLNLSKPSEEEKQLSRDMMNSWINFAHNGQPNAIGPKHIPWSHAISLGKNPSVQYMSLDPNDYKMVSNFYDENCNQFWRPRIFA